MTSFSPLFFLAGAAPLPPFSGAADSISSHIPLALVISVPLTSLILLSLLLIFALCLRRSPSSQFRKGQLNSRQEQQTSSAQQTPPQLASDSASLFPPPPRGGAPSSSLHVNPMCGGPSPYATSLIASQQQPAPESVSSGGSTGRLWRGQKSAGSANDLDDSDKKQTDKEDVDWVEVTNKGNQTPNHWVYSDMLSGNSDLV